MLLFMRIVLLALAAVAMLAQSRVSVRNVYASPPRSRSAVRAKMVPKPHVTRHHVPRQSSKYPSSKPRVRRKVDPKNRRTA